MIVEIRDSAIRDLKQIDRTIAIKLLKDLKKLEFYPKISNIKKLTDHQYSHRLRIGDYRVLFDVFEDTVFVGRILHRKKAY